MTARFSVPASLVFLLVVLAAGDVGAELTLEPVVDGLDSPVRLVSPPGDDRLFVVERTGFVQVFDRDGTKRSTFLDVSAKTSIDSERGLLGLAFAPDYATSGIFYVSYTAKSDGHSILARYSVSADPDLGDAASEEIILTQSQPAKNHNGGHIEFGADGMLYFGVGDGGGAGDTANNAQNPQTFLGKMLRLDVSVATGYAIPADNPFVGEAPLDEIWALGLRNPWCFSFDVETGDLYIADVGQGEWEEVDVQPASSPGGENYGWRLMEGRHCYNPPTDCNDGTLTLPPHEYSHGGNPFRCSISGGYVYRGRRAPDVVGRYFFADWCSGQIWSLVWSESQGVTSVLDHTPELDPTRSLGAVAALGQDSRGEVYVLDFNRGEALRIIDPSVTGIGGPGSEGSSVGNLKSRWRSTGAEGGGG